MKQLVNKADMLVQALPYIRKFNKKKIVIKYGGNAMIRRDLQESVINDISLLSLVGINVVVVHGGGPEINDTLAKLNIKPRFIDGLRYTDQATMEVVQQVLCGKVNKDLVSMITRQGSRAIGLCGMDGDLIQATKLIRENTDYGLVGDIVKIQPDVINSALDNGYIPVVSSIAQGVDGNSVYNVNADTVAARLAVALGAIKLILLTDVRGILRDPDDDSSLIHQISLPDVDSLKEEGIITGGMIPKIDCCTDALKGGVKRAHIIDGRIPHSILMEVLSDEGIGTMITRD
ncbi:MAG TPA: acetylglutamate kinase [Clostridiales bacterium]|nr:acetylglutamate kinase [Clostridiales bacterium]